MALVRETVVVETMVVALNRGMEMAKSNGKSGGSNGKGDSGPIVVVSDDGKSGSNGKINK